MNTETWLPVPGFEGFYEATENPPQVRSVDREISDSRGQNRRLVGKVLQPVTGNMVHLCREGQTLMVDVETVVARTFALATV